MHSTFNPVLLFLCIKLTLYVFFFYFLLFVFLFCAIHSNTFTCNRDIAFFKCGGEGILSLIHI